MRFHGGGYLKGFLDFSSNINPLGVPKPIEEEIRRCLKEEIYKYYPDSNYLNIKRAISYFYDVEAENIVQTNGASEALSLIVLLLKPKYLVTFEPSFGDYELLTKALNVKLIKHRLNLVNDKFIFEFDFVKNLKEEKLGLIIIVNPNNPTGSYVDIDKIIELAHETSNIILLDEAYSEVSDYDTILKKHEDLPKNVVVVKSFTKVFSIPGLRIGFIYSRNRELIEKIDIIRPIWNLNSIVDYSLSKALTSYKKDLWSFINHTKKYIKNERKMLSHKLSNYFQVYKSCTNFIMLKSNCSAKVIHDMLLKRRIKIRTLNNFGKEYLRISVRRREDNEVLIKSIREIFRNIKRH